MISSSFKIVSDDFVFDFYLHVHRYPAEGGLGKPAETLFMKTTIWHFGFI
jgi:hypothetical protein